jgi:hypothetical protein
MPPDQLFTVVFTNHNYEQVYAQTRKEAVVLAQAEQIKKGNTYIVNFVKDENGDII